MGPPKRRRLLKTAKLIQNSQPERLCLVWDFQNSLQNFSSSNIKEVTDLLALTAEAARGPPRVAETAKIVQNSQPERLRLVCDFQNCL